MWRLLGLIMAAVLGGTRAAPAVYFDPVEARVVASARRVEPGMPIAIGVLFRMQRGWHIYWTNPGDAGLPTSVRWTAPAGFDVGAVQWPVPERFEQPGGAVGFGYADSVLLAATLSPPAAWTGGPVALRADVGWLACEKICLRGKKSFDLALAPDAPASVADPELFADWARRLPVDAGAADAPARLAVRGGIPRDGRAGRVKATVTWKRPPAGIEWFPPDDPALDVRAARARTHAGTTRVLFLAKLVGGQEPEHATLESVVVWIDAEGRRRGLRVPIPLDGKEI